MDNSTVRQIIGIALIVIGVVLLIEFVAEFAKLILGVIALVVGISFVQHAQASVRVRKP